MNPQNHISRTPPCDTRHKTQRTVPAPKVDIDTIALSYAVQFVDGRHPDLEVVHRSDRSDHLLWVEYERQGQRWSTARPLPQSAMDDDTVERQVKGAFAWTRVGPFRLSVSCPCATEPQTLVARFSLIKWRHGHNAASVDMNDLERAVAELELICKEHGLIIDGRSGQIVELHLKRDVYLSRPVSDFMYVLETFMPPYSTRLAHYKAGVECGTRRSRWSIYDKTAEVAAMNKRVARRRVPRSDLLTQARLAHSFLEKNKSGDQIEHLLRVEWQIRKSCKMVKWLEIKTVNDLLLSEAQLNAHFQRRVRNDLLRLPVPLMSQIERWRMEPACTEAERCRGDLGHCTQPIHAVARIAYDELGKRLGPQEWQSLLKQMYPNANSRRRFREAMSKARMTSVLPDGTPWAALYSELHSALLTPQLRLVSGHPALPQSSSQNSNDGSSERGTGNSRAA